MIQETIDYLLKRGAERAPTIIAKRGEVFVLPNGAVQDLGEIANKYADAPLRKAANVTIQDIASFAAYWHMHEVPASVIFGDPVACTFTAIFDYHGHGSDSAAGFCQHRAGFGLVMTPEWTTWLSNNGNGRKKNQVQFAEFIEDNTPDIYKPEGSNLPDAAGMLETARELQAKGDMQFVSSIRLSDGKQQFTYNENSTATVGKGNMSVPEEFMIRLVPYVGADVVQVTARLRFRIADGKLMFWYDLLRPHKVQEAAFDSALKFVEKETGKQVFIGKP